MEASGEKRTVDSDKPGKGSSIVIESDNFWSILERETNNEIPTHIKNIMKFSNLDKPNTFKNINDETIKELEEFTRSCMPLLLEKSENSRIFLRNVP